MSRGELVMSQVQDLLRHVPFRPFVLNFENGDRVSIEHPENIAYHLAPDDGTGATDFYVRTGRVRVYSTFAAVTFVGVID